MIRMCLICDDKGNAVGGRAGGLGFYPGKECCETSLEKMNDPCLECKFAGFKDPETAQPVWKMQEKSNCCIVLKDGKKTGVSLDPGQICCEAENPNVPSSICDAMACERCEENKCVNVCEEKDEVCDTPQMMIVYPDGRVGNPICICPAGKERCGGQDGECCPNGTCCAECDAANEPNVNPFGG